MGKSERDRRYFKMIEKLKSNPDMLADIPDYIGEDCEEKEEYRLLVGHWRYLLQQKKNARKAQDPELAEEIGKSIFEVQQYMLMAQFGDRNIGRFNSW